MLGVHTFPPLSLTGRQDSESANKLAETDDRRARGGGRPSAPSSVCGEVELVDLDQEAVRREDLQLTAEVLFDDRTRGRQLGELKVLNDLLERDSSLEVELDDALVLIGVGRVREQTDVAVGNLEQGPTPNLLMTSESPRRPSRAVSPASSPSFTSVTESRSPSSPAATDSKTPPSPAVAESPPCALLQAAWRLPLRTLEERDEPP